MNKQKINIEQLTFFDSLPDKARLLMYENDKINKNFIGSLMSHEINERIKSPIEIIFLIQFLIQTNDNLFIFYQEEIKTLHNKYYVDFLICYDQYVCNKLNKNFKLIIECDGYEFHQKTKEQVEKDNEREYNLKIMGYQIIRFSGSEIYKDSKKCVEKVLDYIDKKNKGRKIWNKGM
jgi:very-short-patch-repair endonuclease